MTFFSLKELNKQICLLLERYNSYKLQTTGISRFKQFIELEQESLSSLPAEPYKIQHYNRTKEQKIGYVFLSEQKNYYSVPYRYIGKHVEVQHTIDTVKIYSKKERIATHAKSHRKGNYNHQRPPIEYPPVLPVMEQEILCKDGSCYRNKYC